MRAWLRRRRLLARVWVTTSGKDGFKTVDRWRLIRAAFSREDVWL